jgi:hypothetical protein
MRGRQCGEIGRDMLVHTLSQEIMVSRVTIPPWCCYWTHRPLQKGVGSSPCVGGSKNVYFDGSYARVLECNPSHVRESPAFATVSPLIHPSLGSLRGASIGATCAPRLSVVCWVCLTALVGFLTRVCSRRVADDDRNSIKAVDSTQ